MERIIVFLLCVTCGFCADAATKTGRLSNYIDRQSYAYMYPYLSNQMRTELNPGTTVTQTNNPMDIVVRTKRMAEPRRVVSRPTASRSSKSNSTATTATRRVVQRPTNTARSAATTNRKVVARSGGRATSRTNPDANVRTAGETTVINYEGVSSSRCLADYTECMNGYCKRENTAYNRCYCSARLAQIDASHQNKITNLITQIIRLRANGPWTEEEMNEYWMERIGQYVGENSWENLDNALNIEWPTTDERIRGQNSFLTGHEYCVQHLRACAYMSSNLRDAYRSKISRDCDAYERALIRVENAAESIIEYYSE